MTDYTLDYPSLRSNTGHTAASLPDPEAAAIYTRAEALYGVGSPVVYPAARELVYLDLLGNAAKLHDYQQNNSRESASQVFRNLLEMQKMWGQRRVDAENAQAELIMGGSARFGRPTGGIPRLMEYPDPTPPFHNWRDISRG